jgi:hypothetical protein
MGLGGTDQSAPFQSGGFISNPNAKRPPLRVAVLLNTDH